jgi:hypothetical protein
MPKHHAEYYLEKAQMERERATALTDADTAAVHHELARGYERLQGQTRSTFADNQQFLRSPLTAGRLSARSASVRKRTFA